LSGDKKGKVELFANLPGFGDNIRLTDRQTLMVPFSAVRKSEYASVLDLLSAYPSVRNFMGKVFAV
jgi:hypothetical protein